MTHRRPWFRSHVTTRAARRLALVVLVAIGAALAAFDATNAAESATPAGPTRTVPAMRQANHVAVLTIDGPIDGVTLRSLERRLEQARRDNADAVVLEINTPGGEVVATRDICHFIRSDCPSNTIAWINPNAYSAGTIIALACREIVVAPDAAFGDAAPITIVPLPQAERDKQESPLRAEVVDSARRNHYDENLVQAFISIGIELWLIEHVDTGERIFVNREEYRTVFGEDPPAQMTPVAPSPDTVTQPVVPWFDTSIPRPGPDQTPGLTEEQIREEVEFQQMLPSARPRLSRDERGDWRLVTQVVSSDRLLTLKPAEAIYFGLAKATIANDEQLRAFFGAKRLTRYERSWSESLVRMLVSWPVRIVLIVIFLICLFAEMAVPGTGMFGAAALGALLVLMGAPYLAGMAQWWDILLVAAGLCLLALEVFVIPGLGVAGISGALCLLVGIVGTFVSGDLSSQQGQEELATGIISMLAALFAAGAGIWLISRQVHSLPVLDRLVLRSELGGGGQRAATRNRDAARPATVGVGETGTAVTDLRPAGRARFGDRIVDVQAPGSYIEKGSAVRVTSVGRYVIEVEDTDA